MAPSRDLLTPAPPPVRIPKLKYRNPLPADEPSPLSPSFLVTAIQDRPTTSDSATASLSSRPSFDTFDTCSLTSPSLASTASSATSSDGSRSSKKKKKTGSVLGFFSLKEPSQVALEHYAAQQRKQMSSKTAALPSPSYGSTFAGKQLPKTVPKVNSKWDGVPNAAKKRHSMPAPSSKDHRGSLSRAPPTPQSPARPSHDSKLSVRTDGTRNPPNSLASPTSSVSSYAIRGRDSRDSRDSRDLPLRDSSTTPTLPEMTYYFPDASPLSNTPPTDTFRELTLQSPNKPPDSTPELSPTRDDSESFRSTSPASSTDSIDTIVRETAETIFKKMNDRPHQCAGDVFAIPTDESKLDHVPESHDFLFSSPSVDKTPSNDSVVTPGPIPHYAPSRPMQNFSRPTPADASATHVQRPPTYRSTTSNSALPTLYEASLASTESLVTVKNDSDAQSIAPSTIAPSVLSMKWHESPRERLGLGGRLRMNDALPWDSHGNPIGKPKKNRLSMFGLGAAKA